MTTTTDYNAQAEKFLQDTGATIAWTFDGFRKHWPDDKEPRNCWKFTITRKGRQPYEGTFGDSTAHTHDPKRNGRDRLGRKFRRTRLGIVDYTRTDENSDAERHRPVQPTAYDLLACLEKNDPGTFEDFCGEFGYDTDSRKALETFLAVGKEWAGVRGLFGDVLPALQEIC